MIIFFVIFLIILYRIWKTRGVSISLFIVSLYLMMYFSSVILNLYYNVKLNSDHTSYWYLFIVLLILLFPVLYINDTKVKYLIIPTDYWLNKITNVLLICSLFSLVYYIPSAISAISIGLANIESVRDEIGTSGVNPFIQRSLFNTIASIFATFYMVQILMFFINVLKDKKIKLRSWLILISSTSYVFLMLSFLGRDGFLFWGFSFLVIYAFFYKFLEKDVIKNINGKLLVFFSIFALAFLYITIGRFLYNSETDIIFPFVNYLGQGPINFADLFYIDLIPRGGSATLQLFFSKASKSIIDYNFAVLYMNGVSTTVFSTLVGSLYLDFGYYGVLVYSFILCIIVLSCKPRGNSTWDFSFILVYMLYLMIMYQGVFYFRLYDRASNLYIILTFTLFFIIKLLPKQMIDLNRNDES